MFLTVLKTANPPGQKWKNFLPLVPTWHPITRFCLFNQFTVLYANQRQLFKPGFVCLFNASYVGDKNVKLQVIHIFSAYKLKEIKNKVEKLL